MAKNKKREKVNSRHKWRKEHFPLKDPLENQQKINLEIRPQTLWRYINTDSALGVPFQGNTTEKLVLSPTLFLRSAREPPSRRTRVLWERLFWQARCRAVFPAWERGERRGAS